MNADTAIYTKLINTAGVTALVSTRVYHDLAPQDVTSPYIVLSHISGFPIGNVSSDTDIANSRVQLTAVGDGKSAVKDIIAAVATALQRLHETVGSVVVEDIVLEYQASGYDDTIDRYYEIVDCLIMHRG